MKKPIQINKVVKHNTVLIAVASQLLKGQNPYDIETLIDADGFEFEILEHFEYNKKEEIYPGGLFLLATGQRLDKQTVWNAYKKSDIIYFFIVKNTSYE